MKDKEWKLSFYEEMDLTRILVIDALQYLKEKNVERAQRKLEFIKANLNDFLSDYDHFTYEERLENLN